MLAIGHNETVDHRGEHASAWGWLVSFSAPALDLLLFSRLTQSVEAPGWTSRTVWWPLIVALNAPFVALLLQRKRAPLIASLCVSGIGAILTLTVGSRPIVSALVALFTAAAWEARRRSMWALLAVVAMVIVELAYEVSALRASWETSLELAIVYGLFVGSAWGVGTWAGRSRLEARRLRETRDALARQAVVAERFRIARELHDIVAHAVTIMTLQASGARRVLHTEPALAADALKVVESQGRQAVAEMRRLLEVLRTVDECADTRQQFDLAEGRLSEVGDLVEAIQATGVFVTLDIVGTQPIIEPSIELAVFRTIQEGLTNATRHGGPGARVEVTVEWGSRNVLIEIVDDGAGRSAVTGSDLSSGHGLIGLGERIKLLGGNMKTGPLARHGFKLSAQLPLET